MTFEVHAIAKIFPAMSDAEFQLLKADIAAHGQREAVWLYEGQVLDGRHRARACEELGVGLRTGEYDGADPTAFVVSLNLHRRHLSESQRGMVAAKLSNLEHGGDRRTVDQAANLPVAHVPQAKAAEMLNVSERTVRAAVKVKDSGSDELIEAVEQGAMSVSLAAKVAALPQEDMQAIAALNEEPEKMREVALEIVHNHRAQGTGENEWYTPIAYVESARQVMGGIDLDPASSEVAQAAVNAVAYFTIDDDGLTKEWAGTVWLMFFHGESKPSAEDLAHGCPSECPTGLFAAKLFDLVVAENHRSPKYDPSREGLVGHGRSGMVYWSPDAFKMFATCEEVRSVADGFRQRAAS